MLLENLDYSELVELFKAAPKTSSKRVDPRKLNKLAMKKGYIVHPDCCNESTYNFIERSLSSADMNSTFYKTWEDVTSRSRLEIFIDQIISYAHTYMLDEAWVPNEGSENVDFSTYTVIKPISYEELFERCMGMLTSGIALKFNTTTTICDYIIAYYNEVPMTDIDVDSIKNREAMTYLCSELCITPRDKFNLLRYIIFKVTGETLMIKNRGMIEKIKTSMRPFDFTSLDQEQLEGLASIFYRFKDIFLAFRHCKPARPWLRIDKLKQVQVAKNRVVINKLRKMAPKFHKPFEGGFWETLLSKSCVSDAVIEENAKDVDSFRLIRLIQTINSRLNNNSDKKLYLIRNGKSFIKDTSGKNIDLINLVAYKKALTNILVERLKQKACVVKYPTDLIITCPTSEKNFVGDIPFGSYFEMGQDNYFGIYWKNDWGTRDFDLSFIDERGNKIGWNTDWYSGKHDVVFSGDVTNAPDGGSEVVLAKKNCPNGIININRYSGNEGSKYQFFFGKSAGAFLAKPVNGYMVDPDTIKVRTMNTSESSQDSIGAVINEKAYLFKIGVQGGRVSSAGKYGLSFLDLMKQKAESFVNLKELLDKAGFTDYNDVDWSLHNKEDFEILDLTNLNRDTLITLFS